MKILLNICILIDLTATSVLLAAQQAPPKPLYTVDLSKSICQELNINPFGTLAFLTEKTLAVSICRNLACSLETFNLEGNEPRKISSRFDEFPHYRSLFRTASGRVILDNDPKGAGRGALVLDGRLRPFLLISEAAGIRESQVSRTGETFAYQRSNDWTVYKHDGAAAPTP